MLVLTVALRASMAYLTVLPRLHQQVSVFIIELTVILQVSSVSLLQVQQQDSLLLLAFSPFMLPTALLGSMVYHSI